VLSSSTMQACTGIGAALTWPTGPTMHAHEERLPLDPHQAWPLMQAAPHGISKNCLPHAVITCSDTICSVGGEPD
jgi:hypothetical protein